MGKNKKAKKFAHKQKKANLRNKSRGKKTVSIRAVKKKKKEKVSIQDTPDSDNEAYDVVEGEKPLLEDFLAVNVNDMSVEDFLEAEFSSDDEDEETPTTLQEPPTKKRKLNEPLDHIEKHKADLEKLKELDPEFYAHLQENAASLLDFGADHVPEAPKEAEESKEQTPDAAPSAGEDKEESDEDIDDDEEVHVLKKFTPKDLENLKAEVKKSPMSGLKKLVIAFKSATSLQNEEEGQVLLHFTDAEVFGAFLTFMVTEVPDIMSTILKVKPGEKLTGKLLNSKPWHRLRPLCRTYITCYANFLKTRDVDETKQFLLFNLRRLIPFLSALKASATAIVKLCVSLWAYGSSGVKRDAFLTILEMSLKMHHSILEVALKHMYLTFVKCVRKVKDHASARAIDFMITSLVEMYGINTVISYQHGFIYIRQLAIHLQKAIKNQQEGGSGLKQGQKRQAGGKKKKKRKKKTGKDAHMTVYNWRFLTCLRLFSKILARHVNTVNDELYPLVYPLVEISLALSSFNKGAIWFPLKLHLCDMLIDLVRNCGIHIPVAPLLLDLLKWPGLRKSIKKSTIAQMDLQFLLKVKEGDLRTKACHEALVETVTQHMLTYFQAYSCSVAFPELAFPITVFLKKMVKADDNLHTKFKKQINAVAKKLQENAEWIQTKRQTCEMAPKDITKINTFSEDKDSSPLERFLAGKEPLKSKAVQSEVEAFLEEDVDEEEEPEEEEENAEESANAAEDLIKEALEPQAKGDVVGDLELSDSDED